MYTLHLHKMFHVPQVCSNFTLAISRNQKIELWLICDKMPFVMDDNNGGVFHVDYLCQLHAGNPFSYKCFLCR